MQTIMVIFVYHIIVFVKCIFFAYLHGYSYDSNRNNAFCFNNIIALYSLFNEVMLHLYFTVYGCLLYKRIYMYFACLKDAYHRDMLITVLLWQ